MALRQQQSHYHVIFVVLLWFLINDQICDFFKNSLPTWFDDPGWTDPSAKDVGQETLVAEFSVWPFISFDGGFWGSGPQNLKNERNRYKTKLSIKRAQEQNLKNSIETIFHDPDYLQY